MTLPPDYYDTAIEKIVGLRDALAPGAVELEFDFQTNAVLINDSWINFFTRHGAHMRLGVSCDGPAGLHDAFRTNWGGKPTFAKVEAGMKRLAAAGIPFKIISVVTERTFAEVDGFYDFLEVWAPHLSGFHFNVLADGALAGQPGLTYTSADRDSYYTFYRDMLARARRSDDSALVVQNFAQAMARILAENDDPVATSSLPIRTINVDAEGYVTTFYAGLERATFADHYGDGLGLALGNITEASLGDMLAGDKFAQILGDFRDAQAACRDSCDYYRLCSGGFELSQLKTHGCFGGGETAECLIIVKTLADAVLDDLAQASAADQAAQ